MASTAETSERTVFPPYVSGSQPLSKNDLLTPLNDGDRVLRESQDKIKMIASAVSRLSSLQGDSNTATRRQMEKLNEQFVESLDVEIRMRAARKAQTDTTRVYDYASLPIGEIGLDSVLHGEDTKHRNLGQIYAENYDALVEDQLTGKDDLLERYAPFKSKYVKFRREIAAAAGGSVLTEAEAMQSLEFGDVVITESYICPLSRKPFVQPVKAVCGHYFSKEYVVNVLNTASSTKCPSPGCRSILRVINFNSDAEMERRTQQWVQTEAERRASENDTIERI